MARKGVSVPRTEGIDVSPAQLFPLAKIRRNNRLRAVDPVKAHTIAISFAQTGQQTPVLVTLPDAEGFADLIFGGHRCAAADLLEWAEIEVKFTGETNPKKLRLLEIDENLARVELTVLDRAIHLAERKRLYEELYPETRAGVAGAEARWHANGKIPFASEAAETLGFSRSTIEKAVSLARNLTPDVVPVIAGTWLADHGKELVALAKQPPEKQLAIARALLREEAPAAGVLAAVAEMEGHREDTAPDDPVAKAYAALLTAWRRAPAKARENFRNFIADGND